MALNPHFREVTRNLMLDQINTTVSASGTFVIYAGTQPANANAATTAANTVVASLALAATAFGAAVSGVATAGTITADATAAGGTAAWFSIQNSTGLRVADGSVGTSGADLNLNSVAISTGANVAISAFTITLAA